jgi:PDZ domain-containing secreted protein
VITAVDGKSVTTPSQIQDILRAHKPGDQLRIAFTRRSGPATASVTLKEDPAFDAVPAEMTGGTVTAEQKVFRDHWLGSQQHKH